MSPRGAAGAAWLLLLIVAVSRLSSLTGAAPGERCEDAARLERLEREPGRGRIPLLVCPGEPAWGGVLRPPVGEGLLLMGGRIDLDHASEEELRALPGIGPGLARRIVADREERGPFGSLEGLLRVRGIGSARVEALRGWASAGGGGGPAAEAGNAADR